MAGDSVILRPGDRGSPAMGSPAAPVTASLMRPLP